MIGGILSVSDTGYGIPHEIRDKILDLFFTKKRRGEGTGMGLSVTLGIVKQYGAMLDFISKPGNGSTFEVYLPIYQRV
jgi:two-component system cell cycle sensor histidine kinase/response regulator CckA